MARIGLVLHPTRDCTAAVGQVADWARDGDAELVAATADARRVGVEGVTPVPAEVLAGTCDGIIAMGGDGTILGAMRLVSGRPVPVLGVNLGHLGFLAEVEGRELREALTAMAEGRVTTESRGCLVVRHRDWEWLAFNDAVLARVPGEGMVSATLSVGGQPYGHLRCDAVILATAMGSTAYNYAAGGPVVSPGIEGVLVTPAAPMSGISRSVLLAPSEPLRLAIEGGSPAMEFDGVLGGRLKPGDSVEVTYRARAGQLVRIEGSRSAARSRVKLSLIDLPYLPGELLELLPREQRERLGEATDPRQP
ncbi:NAD(+)/NADH kinase [Trujillonella endophytica]|uniref:NAD kinase n=1 Tax=Trujillonella endophytica TaxID=673521 RepID=A0A1H8R524_9ACTN|nr:NAD(+)/NADH kinase [Trujillella endophytica]SEO61248.1 NAD+ kinase [Trujillella endophytica]